MIKSVLANGKETMMFNTVHILYMLISGFIGAGLLVLLKIKDSERINLYALRTLAILTVIIHFSSLIANLITTGELGMTAAIIVPIHPCNVCMWLLVISSFTARNEGRVAVAIREFTFLGGTVCGAIGTIFNENFGSNPTLTDYSILKGLLSHSTMVLGCILLFTAGFVKIRLLGNLVSVASGLTLFVADGFIINTVYALLGMPECNSMYLLEAPFPALPWLNTLVIGIFALTVVFIIGAIYEWLALPSEERWYSVIFSKQKKKENKL